MAEFNVSESRPGNQVVRVRSFRKVTVLYVKLYQNISSNQQNLIEVELAITSELFGEKPQGSVVKKLHKWK